MLRLVYQTVLFGPIGLDYTQAVLRVGRSDDNDLVLPHPSVEPHHCILVFRGEKVLTLPPDQQIDEWTDLKRLVGPEFGAGDQLSIGDCHFSLVHSPGSVTIPEVASPAAGADSAGPRDERFYCPRCRKSIPDSEVKRVGLVGQAKRCLCPQCSSFLEERR